MTLTTRNLLAAAIATLTSTGLQAETFVLEELVVTAQKREQSLQDVPVSVNVVGGDTIKETGLADLEDLSAQVPNLVINQSPQNLSIYLRGLGSRDNQGFEQSVGLFVDGVYAGRSKQFQAPLMDLASVEVLRGPQGTLFGKNTIAGAMTVTSAQPTDELEASFRAGFEPRYDSYNVEGVVSGPLTESLSGRLAVQQNESGGYLENPVLGTDEPDTLSTAARATLRWEPSADLEVLAKYEWGRADGAGRNYRLDKVGPWLPMYQQAFAGFDPDDDERRYTDVAERGNTNSDNFTLTVNYQIGEYELTSITGYSGYRFDEVVDGDQSPLNALLMPQAQDFDQWSQEVRIASPLGESFDFIAGLYLQTSDYDLQRGLHTNLSAYQALNPSLAVVPASGAVSDFNQTTDSYALFGSMSWHLNEVWHLTAGLRYTIEEKQAQRDMVYTGFNTNLPLAAVYDPMAAPAGPLPFNEFMLAVGGMQAAGIYEHELDGDRRAENVSPSLKLQYDVSASVMLYASVSQAFKSGGFNAIGNVGDDPGEYGSTPESFDFDEEEALAFELGGKTTLMDGAANVNFAIFRTNYDDLQVSSFQGDVFRVGNAAQAVSQGVEIDGTVRLSETLFLNASVAYLDAYYSKYENAPCTSPQTLVMPVGCSQDLTDRELANAPEWTGNLSLDQEFSLGDGLLLRAHLNVAYVSEQYLALDLDEATLEEAHTTVNGRLALAGSDGGWELALLGKNLTDEEVRSWSNDPFLVAGAYFSYYNAPRTLELQFSLAY
jgi:outer membrane receptor protein involved in Fe transport